LDSTVNQVIIKPKNHLTANTDYVLSISKELADQQFAKLDKDYEIRFRTIAPTYNAVLTNNGNWQTCNWQETRTYDN
jgi:hypothetical protein